MSRKIKTRKARSVSASDMNKKKSTACGRQRPFPLDTPDRTRLGRGSPHRLLDYLFGG